MRLILCTLLLISSFAFAEDTRFKKCGSLKVGKITSEEAVHITKTSVKWLIDEVNEMAPDTYEFGWDKKFEYKVTKPVEFNENPKHLMKICFIQDSENTQIKEGLEFSKIATKKLLEQSSILLAEKYNAGIDLTMKDIDKMYESYKPSK